MLTAVRIKIANRDKSIAIAMGSAEESEGTNA